MALYSDLEREPRQKNAIRILLPGEERPPSNSAVHAQRQQPRHRKLLAAGEFSFILIAKDEMRVVSLCLFKQDNHHIIISFFYADGSLISQLFELEDQALQLVK